MRGCSPLLAPFSLSRARLMYLYVSGVGWGPGPGGWGRGAVLCVRYWFLIRGLRSKHLSLLYTVPVQLGILFAPPLALLKVNYVQMISTEVWPVRTFSKCRSFLSHSRDGRVRISC